MKRNKWFILYKGVLKGLKRGGFQGAAFLRYIPAQNVRKRNRAAPYCACRCKKQRGYTSGRAIFLGRYLILAFSPPALQFDLFKLRGGLETAFHIL